MLSSLLVKHSQSALVPSCPSGFSPLFYGYSFLHIHTYELKQVDALDGSHVNWQLGQDLGGTGSCATDFPSVSLLSWHGTAPSSLKLRRYPCCQLWLIILAKCMEYWCVLQLLVGCFGGGNRRLCSTQSVCCV